MLETCRYNKQVMAKLGQREFPEIPLDESVELARRIHEHLGGEVRRDGLAIVLGMSPTGGAFGARVSALRMWGLATGRSLISLTDQGAQIANCDDIHREIELMRSLSASVPLFNELHEKIGDSSIDQNVLAVTLQEITGAEMDDVTRRVAMVERIYGGIKGFLDPESDHNGDGLLQFQSAADIRNAAALPPGWVEFRYDDGALRMRETVENLDVLIGTLETRRNRLIDETITDNP